MRTRRTLWAYVFLSPALLLFGVTVFYPMLRSLQYSFYKWPLGDAPKTFIGLDNYTKLLSDDSFKQAAFNTAYFVLIGVPLTIIRRRPSGGAA